MNADLQNFTRELDQLIARKPDAACDTGSAIHVAAVLLSLGFESEAAPPADLRARWVSRATMFTKTERKSFLMALRARPILAILTVLLILLALSGVAYAIGRSLGHIPGLGVVDSNTPFLVLAEPVSQTRDGVTITIENAIMNEDKILLTYEAQGLAPDTFSFLEPLNTCMSAEELRFPNGEILEPNAGISSMPLDVGYETTNRYGPVPVGSSDAILFIP